MKIGKSIHALRFIHLPTEVIQHIVACIERGGGTQRDIWSCCLVSRHWYSASINALYERPWLRGRNFERFASTICPPIRAHVRRVEVAKYVRHLDMSELAYESSNSMTARLLGRVKEGLETFVAPARSFK